MTILKENLKMQHSGISITDRIIAVISYLTLGLAGMIWFIVNHLFIKKPINKFLMYNLVQSFILSIIYAIFVYAYGIIAGLLFRLPLIGKLLYIIHVFVCETPIFYTMSLINFVLIIFFIYLSVFASLGQLPKIPYVTDMVKSIT